MFAYDLFDWLLSVTVNTMGVPPMVRMGLLGMPVTVVASEPDAVADRAEVGDWVIVALVGGAVGALLGVPAAHAPARRTTANPPVAAHNQRRHVRDSSIVEGRHPRTGFPIGCPPSIADARPGVPAGAAMCSNQ
jgi:hypothetical protein